MDLPTLRALVRGTASLAEIERSQPVIGAQLKDFVKRVQDDCDKAYRRFSDCLRAVLSLPPQPSPDERQAVERTLREAGDSAWFRDVAKICEDLAALADTYGPAIRQQANALGADRQEDRDSLMHLIHILQQHEYELKYEIRANVDNLIFALCDGQVGQAKRDALRLREEIAQNLEIVNGVAREIVGTGRDGGLELLKKEAAAVALAKPERIFLYNMAFVVALLGFGTIVMLKIPLYSFALLAAFILAVIVVLNAIYLRTVGALEQEPFVELIRLALLNFFAPFARRGDAPPDESAP